MLIFKYLIWVLFSVAAQVREMNQKKEKKDPVSGQCSYTTPTSIPPLRADGFYTVVIFFRRIPAALKAHARE